MTELSSIDIKAMLGILQHSLGVDEYGCGDQYRDHFVTGPGGSDWGICQTAVAHGLMRHRECSWICDGHIFHVTDSGRAFVAEHSSQPPKPTRSQSQYRRYLDADSSMSFGEWVRSERARDPASPQRAPVLHISEAEIPF